MTAVVPFDFAGQQIRVMTDAQGEPWFVAGDVCSVLDLPNVSQAVSRLAADEKSTITSSEGGPDRLLVSEAGLYRLIFTSRRAEAEAFRRWVTHQVLPQIRRTGSYVGTSVVPDVTDAGQLLVLLEAGALAARQLVAAKQEIDALAPRALVADTLLNADGDQSVADTAKELASRGGIDIGRDRLFDVLEDIGWIYKERGDGRWHCYQRAVARGLVNAKPQTRVHPDTGERVLAAPQVRVTSKGLERLLAHLTPSAQLQVAS